VDSRAGRPGISPEFHASRQLYNPVWFIINIFKIFTATGMGKFGTTPTGNGFELGFFEFLRGMVCEKNLKSAKSWSSPLKWWG